MTPNAEYCFPQPSPIPGMTAQDTTHSPLGLVFSNDAAFAAEVRLQLRGATPQTITLHRAGSLSEVSAQLRLHDYAFVLLDARRAPMHATENMVAILAVSPRVPIVVCLGPAEVRPPEKQLLALGAFEIVHTLDQPDERLTAALRHAAWFATSAHTASKPATGFSEPDRPLLAEVSHEMRSPLNSIIGFAETIEQQALGPWPIQQDRYRDYARHIRDSGEHLLALFNDLLQIGDTSSFELEMDDNVNPADIASKVIAMMRSAAEQKGLTLSLDVPNSPLLPLRCNARLLSQALLNLIQNSIKFTNPGGSVVCSITQGDETSFTIVDNGIGFAQERLLLPRNALQGRKPASGHGLGLRFVERVTAAHRGRLQIESQPDKGTEICVSLPMERKPSSVSGRTA